MATGVLVSYPSSALHESRSVVFKNSKELCIRQSKSDPVLLTLSQSSLFRCSDTWDSIEDLAQHAADASVLTIEGLKRQYNSCSTCGVSWYEDHVSLDCTECGGYAMQRPCVHCEGRCSGVWRRDLAASHEQRRAQWKGECQLTAREVSKATAEAS